MNSTFQKNLLWSAGGHIVVIFALVFLLGFSNSTQIPESVKWVDLAPELGQPLPPANSTTPTTSAPPTESAPSTPTEPEVKPEPQPTPKPEPVLPKDPDPLPSPKPIPPPPVKKEIKPPVKTTPPKPTEEKKPKITISNKKVTRPVNATSSNPSVKTSKPSENTEAFNPGAFAKNLLNKLPNSGGLVTAKDATGTGTSATGENNDFAWYFNLIFQEMYGAWVPPFGLDEGLHSQILIRVEKNGLISKVSLAKSSGNQVMDESALAAAGHVKKLQPLPKGLGGDYADITVHFKVQKP